MGRLGSVAPEKSVLSLPPVSSNCPRKTILPASGTTQAGEDTLNREYHLLSSHPCKQAALKQTNRGLGGHMPSERALFSLFVFLPFCVTTMLGMTSEVSEISCLQKENLKVWHSRASSHAQITSFSNNKVSENDNQIPRVTESISAVAGVTQDGN